MKISHLLYGWTVSIMSGETTVIPVIVILIHALNDFRNVAH